MGELLRLGARQPERTPTHPLSRHAELPRRGRLDLRCGDGHRARRPDHRARPAGHRPTNFSVAAGSWTRRVTCRNWPRPLGLETFAVLGSSGGAPYAAACGALIPDRVSDHRVARRRPPADAPGTLAAMSGPLRVMVRLGRFAPPVLRGIFRLNLRAMRGGGQRGHERMAASFPEPDRSLFQRPEVRDGFMACFQESCRRARGARCGTSGSWLVHGDSTSRPSR